MQTTSKMSMVKVDPHLFIKCRLCLEDSGIYQIVPSVREQIIYCFDINVEPFDGLSQLICKKCESILCDYSKTKKSFIEKQEELKTKTRENNLPQEKNDGYSSRPVKRQNSEETAKYVNKRRKIRKLSTSSDEGTLPIREETNSSDDVALPIREETNSSDDVALPNAEDTKKDWLIEYQKTFACRLCDTKLTMLKSAKEHQKLKHQTIKSKYAHYFKKYCLVELPKINSKPNLAGSMDKVVYSKHKIIGQCDSNLSALCYISYDYIGNKSSFSYNNRIKPVESGNLDENSDSSSHISDARPTSRRRRRRVCSRSSNETVVLEDKSNGETQGNDCINIDDTDSEDEKKKKEKTNSNTSKFMNAKMHAVAKLITTTHNKYLKKHEKPEKPSTEQLNRKIISIGRQIINKRGFNSTRLSKFMEHLNLNIIWLSRSPQNVTSNSNYFKIIPRWRYTNEKNMNNFLGYNKKYNKPKEVKTEEATLEQKTKTVKESSKIKKSEIKASPSSVEKPSLNAPPSIVESSNNQDHDPGIYSDIEHNADAYNSNIGSDLNAASPYADTRILLNANPVANPRQLPKKFTSDAKKDKAKSAVNMATLEVKTHELSEVTSSGAENNVQMPIIAFTTSLAVAKTQIDETTTNISSSEIPKPAPTAPRIKVKSVADLNMSTETMNHINNSTLPAPQHQETNGVMFSDCGLLVDNSNLPKINNVRSICPANYNCDDYVILNTVELPNTKSSSPFKYFRTLLQVHNIILLDTDVTLSSDFKNLIRFKVQYNQDSKEEPVVLCLSLCTLGKMFCLKIKDRNNENIDMSKISANWQWEILKIFRGDVVTKVLQNAEKLGKETLENTNSFLCLLKSITRVPK